MELDILLLGKTGSGISATGNSILGYKAFSSVARMASETIKSQKDVIQLSDGRKLRVFCTPGVGDTRGTPEEGQAMFMKAIKQAILMNPYGYHALLLVLQFGRRLTEEDENTVKYLKNVFGQDVIRKYCIIILTHGDAFKHAQDDGDIDVSFLEWCKQQKGFFRSMLEEAGERVILFDNVSRDIDCQISQRQELVRMIDKLPTGGRRYTIVNDSCDN